jgi:hypothetical protein
MREIQQQFYFFLPTILDEASLDFLFSVSKYALFMTENVSH